MKIQNITWIGILIGIIFIILNKFWFNIPEGYLYVGSIIVTIICMIIFNFLYEKIAWNIEPENNPDLLNLNMNRALTYTFASLAFGVSFFLALNSLKNIFEIKNGLYLILSLIFVFVGQIIYCTEYLPRYRKLSIIYELPPIEETITLNGKKYKLFRGK